MNIFIVDPTPAVCAQYLDDKRVVKMVLETCQLLNNATAILHKVPGGAIPYKLTHMHHPCTLWAAECQANYDWLVEYFDFLCAEYTLRYQKEHKCRQYLANFQEYTDFYALNMVDEIEFVNCTTNHKHIDNVFEAYKAELNLKWANDIRTPTWYGVAR